MVVFTAVVLRDRRDGTAVWQIASSLQYMVLHLQDLCHLSLASHTEVWLNMVKPNLELLLKDSKTCSEIPIQGTEDSRFPDILQSETRKFSSVSLALPDVQQALQCLIADQPNCILGHHLDGVSSPAPTGQTPRL